MNRDKGPQTIRANVLAMAQLMKGTDGRAVTASSLRRIPFFRERSPRVPSPPRGGQRPSGPDITER